MMILDFVLSKHGKFWYNVKINYIINKINRLIKALCGNDNMKDDKL